MKFEALILKVLFLAVCVMTGAVMLSMLRLQPDAVRLADRNGGNNDARVTVLQPLPCPLPADGVICFRAG